MDGAFVHLNFVHWYTYTAMILIVIVCLGQALLLVKNRQRLTSISETDPPIIHLKDGRTTINCVVSKIVGMGLFIL